MLLRVRDGSGGVLICDNCNAVTKTGPSLRDLGWLAVGASVMAHNDRRYDIRCHICPECTKKRTRLNSG